MAAEDMVALIRDLSIIAFTGVGVVVLVVATVLGLLLYRKVSPLLDSSRATMKQAQEISSLVSERMVKPLLSTSAIAYSAGRVVAFILGLSRGKGGRKDGE